MKFLKRFFQVIFICFLVLVGAVIGLTFGFVDWPTLIQIKMHGKCPSEIVEDRREIDFLGYELILPEKLITECFAYTTPDLGGFDPASVNLDAELPNFSPLEGVEYPKIYKSDDQIRITIYGYEALDESTRTNDFGLEKALEHDLSRKNRIGKPIYSKSNGLVYGLEHYISDQSIPIHSGDIYVAKDKNRKVEFYLECCDEKEKNHRYWNCNSNSFFIKYNVSYHYYYNSQYLPDARKINQKVKEMVKISE